MVPPAQGAAAGGRRPPPRVCSLLPSATEIVGALGLGDALVAVSHECDVCPGRQPLGDLIRVTRSPLDPAALEQGEIHARVLAAVEGGLSLYKVDPELLEAASPTVILTQMLCEVCAATPAEVEAAVCQALASRPRVVNLEPGTVAEIAASIQLVADSCGVPERGPPAVRRFEGDLAAVAGAVAGARGAPSVLLLEWLDPPFDGGHWVPEQILNAGARPAWGNSPGAKSRVRTWEEVAAAAPDVVLVACCGFDLERNLADARKSAAGKLDRLQLQGARVFAVDGNRFFARPSPSVAAGSAIVARCAFDGQADVVAKLEALPFLPREGEGWARLPAPPGGEGKGESH